MKDNTRLTGTNGKRNRKSLRPKTKPLVSRLGFEPLEKRRVMTVGFTAGDIAVLDLAAATKNTTGSVLELAPSTANQSSPAMTIGIASTGPSAMRFSDTGTSSFLSDTNDQSLLAFAAYNSTNSSVSDLATLTSAGARAVATLNSSGSGSFTLQTTYTDSTSGNQTRSATSLDDSNWFITDKGGLYTNGATTPSLATNLLDARSFGGVVYVSSTSATAGVSKLSSPTASALVGLPGIAADSKIQDFYLIQSGHNGTTYDVMYTLDQGSSNATINKFSLVNGSWVSNGAYTYAPNAEGMIAANNGSGGASLYVTTSSGTAGNSLVQLTDTTGYNTSISITTANNVTLFTAASGNLLKGLDFAPVAAAATTTAITSISPLTVNQGQSVTLTATVTANSGSLAPSGGMVEFLNNGTLLATATSETINGAVGTFSVSSTTIPAGSYSNIQAVYSGNAGFIQSTSSSYASTLTVNSAIGTTTAIGSASPLTSNTGSPVTFSATVTALSGSSAPGAGSVEFYSGGTGGVLLATASSEVTSGTTATFSVTTSSIAAGNYGNIQAFYTPSVNFAASNSSALGSTLQITPPGVIAAWTFPSTAGAGDNSPAPTYGSGTATTLGMTNSYNGGNTASDDVLATAGTANTNFNENTWRIRGAGNNGWALAAPQYSQGVELDTSTVGYSNIVFSFDWYSTTQGIRDLQVQYNTGSGWVNYQGPSPTGTFVTAGNDYYNSLLSPENPTIYVNLSGVAAANNNPDLGIRLVSAYDSTGTLGDEYASAASTSSEIVPYNNSSGNWRFDNLTFSAGVTTTTTIAANPPVGQSPGQNVTFTATVTPASGGQFPTGTVTFFDGTTLLGSQSISQVGATSIGTASITLDTLAAGVHGDITAQYAPTLGNGLIASGSSMNLVAGDPTDNPISYTINAPQATGVDISPIVGQPFTGVVATFSDGSDIDPSGMTATINWGDGHISSGAIAYTGSKNETNINGQIVPVSLFTVTGTNTYATTGDYPLSIGITDPNNNSATVAPTAWVAFAPLAVTGVPLANVVAGAALTDETVATFTDPGLVANLTALGISSPFRYFLLLHGR